MDALLRALADPEFYPHAPATVAHVQTHISHVFLADPYAYKLKKAVRFPFLDFSTAERRREACVEEVRLNRRLCPGVYLDVVPITGSAAEPRLGGTGPALDHVVAMRRLPADGMLPHLLATGRVRGESIDELARVLAVFHAAAPTGPDVAAFAEPDVLRRRWEEEATAVRPLIGRLLRVEDHKVIADFGPRFIRSHETLLRARQQAQRIREGHGDLHAGNVCIVETPLPAAAGLPSLPAGVYPFDCIEFSRALRCADVAAEVAFLAMDLEGHDRPELARRFVDAYVAASGDTLVPILLPFYAAYRALVRAKVDALKSDEADVDAAERAAAGASSRRHFALAARFAWQASGPSMIAVCGLSGTGKSTLAAELAAATGFALISTDAIRKQRGAASRPGEPYATGLYAPEARAAVYDALCEDADRLLAAGRGVVADATFLRAEHRARVAAVAHGRRRSLVFVECIADDATTRARLAAREREGALSDARWETHLAQRTELEPFTADESRIVVDTTAGVAAARAAALRAVWRWRSGA
jgi:aminoglycoside phosphotransferase family enzyme/predicted kinase